MKKLGVAALALGAFGGIGAGIAIATSGAPSVAAASGTFDLAPVAGKFTIVGCTGPDGSYVTEGNQFKGTITSGNPQFNGLTLIATASVTVNFSTGAVVGTGSQVLKDASNKTVASGKTTLAGALNLSTFELKVRGFADLAQQDPATGQKTGGHVITNYEGDIANTIDTSSHLTGSFGKGAKTADYSVVWNGFTC